LGYSMPRINPKLTSLCEKCNAWLRCCDFIM